MVLFEKRRKIATGLVKAYLGECADGRWLAVITNSSLEESEVFDLKTRLTAMHRIRTRGFYTRIRKIYSSVEIGKKNE